MLFRPVSVAVVFKLITHPKARIKEENKKQRFLPKENENGALLACVFENPGKHFEPEKTIHKKFDFLKNTFESPNLRTLQDQKIHWAGMNLHEKLSPIDRKQTSVKNTVRARKLARSFEKRTRGPNIRRSVEFSTRKPLNHSATTVMYHFVIII